jgi:hypothetical protein
MNIIFSPFFFSFLRYFSGKKRITIKEFTFKLITKYANCKFIFKININYFTYEYKNKTNHEKIFNSSFK